MNEALSAAVGGYLCYLMEHALTEQSPFLMQILPIVAGSAIGVYLVDRFTPDMRAPAGPIVPQSFADAA